MDQRLLADIQDLELRDEYLQDFFTVMALCNTVVVSGKARIHCIDEGQRLLWGIVMMKVRDYYGI